jgi:hypothetical protein
MDDDLTEQRFELHEERLDHYGERIKALEGDDDERKGDEKHAESMRVNWAMVGMFAGELALAVATLYLMMRHA